MRRHLKKHLPHPDSIRENRWLRPFSGILLHPRLWHLNRHSAAGAVAAGLFCGLIPGPFQMLGAALCALIFRVNLPLAMLVTLYTNPFTIVPIYLLAYQIGRWLTGDATPFSAPPDVENFDLSGWLPTMLDWMASVGKPLGVGLLTLAVGLAIIGYVGVKAAWRLYLVNACKRRRAAKRAVAP